MNIFSVYVNYFQLHYTITNTTIQIITEYFFRLRKKYSEVFLTHSYCVNNFQKLQKFLFDDINNLKDPFLLLNMQKTLDRINKAIINNEKILIFGDYDVDGITSITVLKKFLKTCGLEADYYIPNRLSEGYGLNKAAIDYIKEKEYTLIITVDCGISGIE